jgi:uncharacterized lipoprotein
MGRPACLLCLAVVALTAGCSGETAKRSVYETLQNVREQDCLKDPNSPSDCAKRDSYDDYQRKRKELEPGS